MQTEHKIDQEEIEFFERLIQDEKIHNALGLVLSQYRESILTSRNRFVERLGRKYNLEKPRELTYDPLRRKIVSIYDPGLEASNIDLSVGLRERAQSTLIALIETLRKSDAGKRS